MEAGFLKNLFQFYMKFMTFLFCLLFLKFLSLFLFNSTEKESSSIGRILESLTSDLDSRWPDECGEGFGRRWIDGNPTITKFYV